MVSKTLNPGAGLSLLSAAAGSEMLCILFSSQVVSMNLRRETESSRQINNVISFRVIPQARVYTVVDVLFYLPNLQAWEANFFRNKFPAIIIHSLLHFELF